MKAQYSRDSRVRNLHARSSAVQEGRLQKERKAEGIERRASIEKVRRLVHGRQRSGPPEWPLFIISVPGKGQAFGGRRPECGQSQRVIADMDFTSRSHEV